MSATKKKSAKLNQQSEIHRIAATGMYFAAAELCKRGFNVTPTARNQAGADLLITDDNCQIVRTVQVKTTDQSLKRRRGWLIGRRFKETVSPSHYYVFVMLNGDEQPDFFIVPSKRVISAVNGAASMPEFRKDSAGAFEGRWDLLNR